jgi:hypothetical protein
LATLVTAQIEKFASMAAPALPAPQNRDRAR